MIPQSSYWFGSDDKPQGEPTITELPAEDELTCGCDARDEPCGLRSANGEMPRDFLVDPFESFDTRGRRVMLLYPDGTVRHRRCGQVSEPMPKLERFFDVLDDVLKRID
jgi:hypothetical protein